LIPKEVRTKVA